MLPRRTLALLSVALVACAQGSLDGPTSFGFTVGMTNVTVGDGGEESTGGGSDSDTSAGSGSTGGSASASADGGSTSTGAAEGSSSDSGLSASASMSAGESSSGASASADGGSMTTMDPPPPPPMDVGPWEDCANANCEAGNDCIELTDVMTDEPYCSPQCTTDADCPLPATGDALPICALSADGAADPTNCALLCEYDNLPYGTCPNGMTCTDIPGQTTQIALCVW
ncbi:MAG: hypothetical protein K1X88_27580 [Nannocystaceae bacterium]|nr:hypothetical protein [Nannocystaceae bacterium]